MKINLLAILLRPTAVEGKKKGGERAKRVGMPGGSENPAAFKA